MALVLCQYCKNKHEKSDMECVELQYKNGTTRKYFHKGECYTKYLSEKEFKQKESEELDALNEIIKQLHNIDLVPSQFFSGYLQGLRNGNFKMGKKVYKYKEGFSYKLIADTYIFCKDSIKWARDNRKFDGTMAELKYCMAIVADKIQVVKKRQDKLKANKKIEEEKKQIMADQVEDMEREVVFKKRKNDKDISNFLN